MDREILMKMKEAGAVRLIFGMETASPRLLKFIGKTITPEQIAGVLCWAHEVGIWTGIEIIAGLPTERDNDIEATIDFLKQNHRYIDEAYLNAFFLDRNSLMYKYPQRYNIENIRIRGDRTFISPASYSLAMNRFVSLQFDETDGLKWKDKSKQIEDSYRRILKVLTDLRMFVIGENETVSPLFYLHSIFQHNDVIKEIYFDYLVKRHCKRILSLANVIRSIEEIKSQGTLKDKLSVIKRKALTAGIAISASLRK
jgi:hypothetical protein